MKSHGIGTLNFCVSLEEKNNVLIPLKKKYEELRYTSIYTRVMRTKGTTFILRI